jgi:hypothetical protein
VEVLVVLIDVHGADAAKRAKLRQRSDAEGTVDENVAELQANGAKERVYAQLYFWRWKVSKQQRDGTQHDQGQDKRQASLDSQEQRMRARRVEQSAGLDQCRHVRKFLDQPGYGLSGYGETKYCARGQVRPKLIQLIVIITVYLCSFEEEYCVFKGIATVQLLFAVRWIS